MKQITRNGMRALILASGIAIVGLGAGCATMGPNTQRGAVAGAAVGGVTGAIIGNQSGRTGEGAAVGAAIGAAAGGALGNSQDSVNYSRQRQYR